MCITLSFKLIPEKEEDIENLKNLMRWKSSAIRFAYNRLKEGWLKQVQSLRSELSSRLEANGRDSEHGIKAWQVLKGRGMG